MAVTEETILAGVVTLENQFTRIFVNMLNDDPVLCRRIVRLIVPGAKSRRSITVKSHFPLRSTDGKLFFGIPDITIRLDNLVVLIEVKTSQHCGFTPRELPNCPHGNGYYNYLEHELRGRVIYILPQSYLIEDKLEIRDDQIIRWHEIAQELRGKLPLQIWFKSILEKRFAPVRLTSKEVSLLKRKSSALGPTLRLLGMTQEIRTLAAFEWKKKTSNWALSATECGFYIEDFIFVGIYPFDMNKAALSSTKHKKSVAPISPAAIVFGVDKSAREQSVRFVSALKLEMQQDPVDVDDGWLYGLIGLDSYRTAAKVWHALSPIIGAAIRGTAFTPR